MTQNLLVSLTLNKRYTYKTLSLKSMPKIHKLHRPVLQLKEVLQRVLRHPMIWWNSCLSTQRLTITSQSNCHSTLWLKMLYRKSRSKKFLKNNLRIFKNSKLSP